MSHLVQTTALTAQAVNQALSAALSKAQALGQSVAMCVCSPQGIEQGFLRMSGTPDLCADNARDKAYTAAGFGVDTKTWEAVLEDEAPRVLSGLKERPRFVAFGGGLPIVTKDGTVVGGIGISGASEDEDEAIALSGLSILELNIRTSEH